ncbi:helix-turn-helix domain-containing protein [Halogeometricum limi]|uniref:Transcriptional regulator, XRE family n=1 Tax=Halogeometricum limi TaxID=555875 RepID=A0A1I6I169_9EURY|nr:multiprotein-bridging factor 1 family protein [Halogeometricum limi]SFR60443.1 transcriptional regulator, XRE family [Halogeometricum limi]
MPKYSTGGGGGGSDGESCELCGRSTPKLRRANVAGANLLVCPDCAPHDDSRHGKRQSSDDDASGGEPSRKKRAAQRQAKMYDQAKGDAKHWEKEGTNYEKDRLPYLVSGYGGVVEQARQDAGLTAEELADELETDEKAILAVEQGRATRAGVGGSLIRKLEERLDVALVDE